MTRRIIEVKASELRARCGLTADEPVNMRPLLLRLNILTVFKPLAEHFSGMCLKKESNMFILVNSRHSIGRQHFTIAHEFFHLFVQETFDTHYCNPGFNSSPQEKDADYFASVFLMPELGLTKMIPEKELREKDVSLATLLLLEQCFGVSRGALLIRLASLKLVAKESYKRLSEIPVIRSAKEYGYDTSLYQPGNEGLVIGDYGVKARSLFDRDLISEGHYVELLSKIGVDPTQEDD